MINGRKIRLNARSMARKFTHQMHDMHLNMPSVGHELYSKDSEIFKSSIRGAMKAVHVKFKDANLDAIALRHPAFKILLGELLNESDKPISQTEMNYNTLLFLNNCMMIEKYGDVSVPTEDNIGIDGMAYVSKIWEATCSIFMDLVEEVEEFYFSDFCDKTHMLAGNLYLAKNQGAMRLRHEGNLPLETAMHTS